MGFEEPPVIPTAVCTPCVCGRGDGTRAELDCRRLTAPCLVLRASGLFLVFRSRTAVAMTV